MPKKGTKLINKKGLNYVIGTNGMPLRFKPWLGDSFSFLYDFIMRKSIFPKKFGGDEVLKEVNRVLAFGSVFVCAVPVPERNTLGSTIRGKLHSEEGLARLFGQNGFGFEIIPRDNGALLYFRGVKENS